VRVGAPLLAGYLVGRERHLYGGTVPAGGPQTFQGDGDRGQALCGSAHRGAAVRRRAAGGVGHRARNAAQAAANATSTGIAIPDAFWEDLRAQNIIAARAPVSPPMG
jgi:D-threo-aldose 1-dehydrogenase